jgi:hypothetical protein
MPDPIDSAGTGTDEALKAALGEVLRRWVNPDERPTTFRDILAAVLPGVSAHVGAITDENEARDVEQLKRHYAGQRVLDAVRDLCWKATPYGETEDSDVAAYLLPKGTIHRLVGAMQGDGHTCSLRDWNRYTTSYDGEVELVAALHTFDQERAALWTSLDLSNTERDEAGATVVRLSAALDQVAGLADELEAEATYGTPGYVSKVGAARRLRVILDVVLSSFPRPDPSSYFDIARKMSDDPAYQAAIDAAESSARGPDGGEG